MIENVTEVKKQVEGLPKNSYIHSSVVGVVVNSVIIMASIFLSFKSGISSTIDTAALVLLVLLLIGRFTIKNAVVAEIIARGSIAATRQAATYFAAILIFSSSYKTADSIKMFFIILVSSVLGVLFFSCFYEYFDNKDKFSFPMVKPRIDLFNALSKDKKNNGLILSLSLTSLYSFLVNIMKIIPKSFKFIGMFGIDNNPMLIAIGYLIGYDTYLIMGIGFLYSVIIYLIYNSKTFVEQLMNPYIFSVVISFILTQGFITIFSFVSEGIKKLKNRKIENANLKRTTIKELISTKASSSSIVVLILFLLFNMLFFSRYLNPANTMPFWIFLILVPITVILGFSTLHGVAKTGFWFSALEDLLPILIILLTFTTNITTIIMIITSLIVFEMSGIYFIVNAEFSSAFGITKKQNIYLNILSNFCGALFCVGLVYIFSKSFVFGSEQLPIPYANTLGMTIKGMVESLSNNILPSYINVYVIITSCIICIILNKCKLSPIIIIGGIMLPFSIYITMSIGAILSYKLRGNKSKYRPIFSGMATADGVISSLSAMSALFR